ncbi:hypothetical protein A7K94_0208230, partial [Modestobacter sp. VKM Ac-2676]
LELALAAAGPDTGRLAVVSCNLDGITALEDVHGRLTADAARAEAAGRLVTAVRQGDVVARISAQTFVLLCPASPTPPTPRASPAGSPTPSTHRCSRPPGVSHRIRLSVGGGAVRPGIDPPSR